MLKTLLKEQQDTSYQLVTKLATKLNNNYQISLAFTLKEVCEHLYLTNYFALNNFAISFDYTHSKDLRVQLSGISITHSVHFFSCHNSECIIHTLLTTRLLEQQIQALIDNNNALRYSWLLVVRDV